LKASFILVVTGCLLVFTFTGVAVSQSTYTSRGQVPVGSDEVDVATESFVCLQIDRLAHPGWVLRRGNQGDDGQLLAG
jgi:hypothetical protein